ncbi:MAG: ANTAR domain-containing protein [Endomicrobiaceae bacterium]|jgi:response regulator NasT|nr:ANTAR domain-containing protein [Endomicrobiaceae bacterium]
MDNYKILLVCSDALANEIKSILSSSVNIFSVVYVSNSGNDALRKVSVMMPAAVIADYSLLDMNGFTLASKIEELRICPTIILTNIAQSDFINELKKTSIDIFCITKPINNQVLLHTTELAVRLSHRFYDMEKKVLSLEQQIEERKNVDRARGILMKKFKLDEAQAYRNLQKKAMDSGRTINDIAKTIIKMFDFIDEK